MNFKPIDLSKMTGREQALRAIKRYKDPLFEVMFYRTNLLDHSRRVCFHLEEAAKDILAVYPRFDFERARVMAQVHDDAEIITGDVMLYKKESMTEEELKELARRETEAIPLLVERFGLNAGNYDYVDLLIEAKGKETLESQFVSFFDKLEGGGEAWHEVFAGNPKFLRPSGGKDFRSGGYIRRLKDFRLKYEMMGIFFSIFPEYLPKPFDFQLALEVGKPHDEKSIHQDSGFPCYELWKKAIIKRAGIEKLITQVEFY